MGRQGVEGREGGGEAGSRREGGREVGRQGVEGREGGRGGRE